VRGHWRGYEEDGPLNGILSDERAEGVGFEPTWGDTPTCFQDRRLKPLGHPSSSNFTTIDRCKKVIFSPPKPQRARKLNIILYFVKNRPEKFLLCTFKGRKSYHFAHKSARSVHSVHSVVWVANSSHGIIEAVEGNLFRRWMVDRGWRGADDDRMVSQALMGRASTSGDDELQAVSNGG
jgi:hypothetical protein